MNLEMIRLLFDFGLLVLIWLVQLVIYPGFHYYSKENLISWHRKYATGISMVVVPLMFGQLITASLQLFQVVTMYTLVSIVLITVVWISTFAQFVPLHKRIASGTFDKALLRKLVKFNWIRTLLWSLILSISASKFM